MPKCQAAECENDARSLNLCNKHYIRHYKARKLAGLATKTAYVIDPNDFWAFVKKELAL